MSQILTDCRFTVRCLAWRANSGSNTPRDIRRVHELGLDRIGYRVACTWQWRDSRGDNVGYLRLIGGVHESTRIDTNPCNRDWHFIRGIRVHSWMVVFCAGRQRLGRSLALQQRQTARAEPRPPFEQRRAGGRASARVGLEYSLIDRSMRAVTDQRCPRMYTNRHESLK